MKKIWAWINTPFEYLPWWGTLIVGFLCGIAIGVALGAFLILVF